MRGRKRGGMRVAGGMGPMVAWMMVVVALATAMPGGGAAAGDAVSRDLQPVVLTGAQLPGLSVVPNYVERPPAPFEPEQQDGYYVPVEVVTGQPAGADVDRIVAYRFDAASKGFVPIPVQVDERFARYLTNYRSGFGDYSQADWELTYTWDIEGQKKEDAGAFCTYSEANLAPFDPLFAPTVCSGIDEAPARACHDGGAPPRSALCDPADATTPDPVPGLDHDDEVVFMFADAGRDRAATGQSPGDATDIVELEVRDPLSPLARRYVYIGLATGAVPSFTPYVSYERGADADDFVQAVRGGYGGAGAAPQCFSNDGVDPEVDGPTGLIGDWTDPADDCDHARARDDAWVTTDTYRFHYAGRWKMDALHVSDGAGGYADDLIDRWKGRAFQLREDVGLGASIAYEDETYWSKSSMTMGERVGPVRVLRETVGADSGTPTTRLDSFYAHHFTMLFHLRVHPIPPDGINAFWDHKAGSVDTFYSAVVPDGVPIDGVNDEALFCRAGDDPLPNPVAATNCPGDNAVFLVDLPDPTVQVPVTNLAWDQVTGDAGTMVSTITALQTQGGVLTPYYRDDARFDDGTGHDPSPSLQKNGCDPDVDTCQGSFGAHGAHFFFTQDTDNLMTPVPVTEFVVETAQYLLPGRTPNLGAEVALLHRTPIVAAPAPPATDGLPAIAPLPGFLDADGDGWLTILERLLGSDGFDASDTPLGLPGPGRVVDRLLRFV